MRQISPGTLLLLFFAGVIGLGAAYFVRKSLQKPAPPPIVAKPKEPVYLVIMASVDLPPGRVIHSGDFMNVRYSQAQYVARKWPAVMLADGKQIVGRTLKKQLKKGDPFEPDSFYPEGTGPDISELIEPGLRAVTVNVLGDSSFPAQAMPGSVVDVIFRAKANPEQRIPEVTRTLMERVKILAIGNNATPGIQGGIDPKSEAQAVTLAVSPHQATILKVAEGHGDLTLALRGSSDAEVDALNPDLTLSQLLRIPPEPPPPAPPPPPFVAEVYRHGQRQTLTFKPTGGVQADQGNPPAVVPPPVVPQLPPANAPPADPAPPAPRNNANPPRMNRVS
ncbi:Flp pilus assembly protein CpaB [Anatilimnocola floriformis]|uniref:Flp pilus assembly protein CpaB n=1 Tax=Anatilimnocola floriformis TaxID=2948575 RepID=UPI0020C20BCD|nr:Flp pilus assembly protein CpaB [Anatilimnocola floriformis]